MTGETELWATLAGALDEAELPLYLRDQIDNAVSDLVRAERADVLSCLVIAIDDDAAGLQAITRRSLD